MSMNTDRGGVILESTCLPFKDDIRFFDDEQHTADDGSASSEDLQHLTLRLARIKSR